jgi:hypothetical protein
MQKFKEKNDEHEKTRKGRWKVAQTKQEREAESPRVGRGENANLTGSYLQS